jgi:hypothetical protein
MYLLLINGYLIPLISPLEMGNLVSFSTGWQGGAKQWRRIRPFQVISSSAGLESLVQGVASSNLVAPTNLLLDADHGHTGLAAVAERTNAPSLCRRVCRCSLGYRLCVDDTPLEAGYGANRLATRRSASGATAAPIARASGATAAPIARASGATAAPIARASSTGFSGTCAPAHERCSGGSSRETETAGVDITE